jgi:hypothetical protein
MMGKRSKFEHRDRDYYATPQRALLPLVPHLSRVHTFAEPCCGDGRLVRWLESSGLRCVYAGDIAAGQDALACDDYGAPDAIITNPPFTRSLLHRLLSHFLGIAPAWLLLPMDFASNERDAGFLACCTDVLPFGRVRWIEGTKNQGKDNFGWFHFRQDHSTGPVIHPRGAPPIVTGYSRSCEHGQCGRPYHSTRSDSRFCSATCRQRAHRQRTNRDIKRDINTMTVQRVVQQVRMREGGSGQSASRVLKSATRSPRSARRRVPHG